MTDDGRPMKMPTDDAIRDMLERRASRGQPVSVEIAAIVANAGRRGSRRNQWNDGLISRIPLASASVAAILVASLVVGFVIANRPVGQATPSRQTGLQSSAVPSTTDQRPTPAPTPFAFPPLLTPAELDALIKTRSDELDQRLVAVRGRIRQDLVGPCSICDDLMFEGDGLGFRMRRPPAPTAWGPDPADFGLVDRTYVIRITNAHVDGRPLVDLLGEVATGRTHGLTVPVGEALQGGLGAGGQFVAIDGWLVRTPLHPCPALPLASGVPSGGPTYGCPDDDYLTDLEFQPLQGDGSSVGPADAVYLPAGSYDEWAPSPIAIGPYGIGVEPRRATYLLQLSAVLPSDVPSCPPTARCFPLRIGTPRWQIVGRLDPIWDPIPSSARSPSPSTGGIPTGVWARVADLAVLPLSAAPADYQVHAYLVRTPPLKCLAVSAALPNYSCDEVDWLTDEPFQPWVADGNSAGTHEPAVGLRVQNGAYDAFATDPAIGPFGAREPRLGSYLVRRSTAPMCTGGAQSSGAPCYGGLGLHWEVVARLP